MSHAAFGSVSCDTDEKGSRTSTLSSKGHPRYIKGEFVLYKVPGKAILEPRDAAQIPSDSGPPPSESSEQMDKIDQPQTLSVDHGWEKQRVEIVDAEAGPDDLDLIIIKLQCDPDGTMNSTCPLPVSKGSPTRK